MIKGLKQMKKERWIAERKERLKIVIPLVVIMIGIMMMAVALQLHYSTDKAHKEFNKEWAERIEAAK